MQNMDVADSMSSSYLACGRTDFYHRYGTASLLSFRDITVEIANVNLTADQVSYIVYHHATAIDDYLLAQNGIAVRDGGVLFSAVPTLKVESFESVEIRSKTIAMDSANPLSKEEFIEMDDGVGFFNITLFSNRLKN